MLQSVTIQRFKSLRNITLDLSSLNIIVGPNHSGKSAVLQAIMLLEQSYKESGLGLVLNGHYLSLGEFRHLVYRRGEQSTNEQGNQPGSIYIGISFNPSRKFDEVFDPFHPLIWGIEATSGSVRRQQVGVYPNRHLFDIDENGQFKWPAEIKTMGQIFSSSPSLVGRWQINGGGPEYETAQAILSEIQGTLDKLFMIGPIRGITEVTSQIEPALASEIGVRGEHLVSVIHHIQGDPDYSRQLQLIKGWAERFGLKDLLVRLSLGPTNTLSAVDPLTQVNVDVSNAGFGANNLLPVIAQCFLAPKGSTIMVEEPEAHLHPAFQALLVDLFLDVLNFGNQLILTTHSEHLILRLQTRIAQRKIAVGGVKIFAMTKGLNGSAASEIKVDDKGLLSKMPAGFFEEGLNEALDHARAVSNEGSSSGKK